MNSKALNNANEEKTNGPEVDGFDWGEQLVVSHGGGGGQSKYDWDAFPEPKDGRFPTKTYTGINSAKTIYASIKKYRAKLAEDKKEDREFVVKVNRDGKGKAAPIIDIKVQRIK